MGWAWGAVQGGARWGTKRYRCNTGYGRKLAATRGTEKVSEVQWGGGETLMTLAKLSLLCEGETTCLPTPSLKLCQLLRSLS